MSSFFARNLPFFIIFCIFLNILSPGKANQNETIILQSTTSTENSGFYDYILPLFFRDTGIHVRVIAVGTGQALKNAANGDGDILITHSKQDELRFVTDGFGLFRRDLMYNDFIFIGPRKHQKLKIQTDSISLLLKKISNERITFVSRGDDSGTHKKELKLWEAASLRPSDFQSNWYKETGSGMGNTLNIAAALSAVTIKI